MQQVGIGMIGCGGMGRHVARLLLQQDARLAVRALCDPDPRSISKTQAEVSPGARVYADYNDLVQADDLDWVMVASWNCFHREQVIAAFAAGKDVFCQKPLATTLADCLAMRDAHQSSGKLFNLGFSLRYSAHYRKIKELLDQGAVGQIISMEFNETLGFNHGGYIMGDWRRLQRYAGTHLLEKCCHDIDLAHWMVQILAVRVASFGGLSFFLPQNEHHIARLGKNEKGVDAYRTWGGLVDLNPFTSDKDIVDNQVAIVEYANGVRATFHTNCNAGIPERRMYILGSEGALRADLYASTIQLRRIGFDAAIEDAPIQAMDGHGGGDAVLARELSASMLERVPPSVGMWDAVTSAITCFAIDEAMNTGRVVDVRPYWEKAGAYHLAAGGGPAAR